MGRKFQMLLSGGEDEDLGDAGADLADRGVRGVRGVRGDAKLDAVGMKLCALRVASGRLAR